MEILGNGEEMEVFWLLEIKGLFFFKKLCLNFGLIVMNFFYWVIIFSVFILKIFFDFCSFGI